MKENPTWILHIQVGKPNTHIDTIEMIVLNIVNTVLALISTVVSILSYIESKRED